MTFEKVARPFGEVTGLKIFRELAIIFALCLAGILLAELLPFAMPSNVLAMLLLFVLLVWGAVKPCHVQTTSEFMLKNMSFLFLPSIVGVSRHFDLLRSNLLPFIAVCVISTCLTFAATAYTVKGVLWLQRRVRGGKGEA